MIPNISNGGKMTGLVMYLAGPGRANEHAHPHVVAASSGPVSIAGGAGMVMTREQAAAVAEHLDMPRLVFGTEVARRDKGALAAAMERGVKGEAAIALATRDENVWHCSLSLSPEETDALTPDGATAQGLSDERWQRIAEEFMVGMGFDSEGDAPARWVAIRHGLSKAGGDHIHIAASRVRDDGSVVKLWFPEPGEQRPKGDKWRAQNVCARLEESHGLKVTTGRAQNFPAKGTSPAQENIAARTGRAEPAKTTLARRVRGVAAAAESEAEFVRMARAHGLLVRPRYAPGSTETVVGYSVALPTEAYATTDGRPVWHGGGKLGNDLSLPRLREHWAAPDEGARADAVSAWAHSRESLPAGGHSPATSEGQSRAWAGVTADQAKDRLRAIVAAAAKGVTTEDGFVSNLYTHREVLIRPRFAAGSTEQVVGYSVALRPSIYADGYGKPVWHGGGKLDNALSLPALRSRWLRTPGTEKATAYAWGRAAGLADKGSAPKAGPQYFSAYEDAKKWRGALTGADAPWTRAAGEAAGVVSAWASTAERQQPAELSRIADALAATTGERRPPRPQGAHAGSIMRRAAAMIIAAGTDDPRFAWVAMFGQVAATCRAISDAAEARGELDRARELRAAIDAATGRYSEITDSARADGLRLARPAATAAATPAARTTSAPAAVRSPSPTQTRRDRDDYGR
ncbi:relaxase [Rhodococcus sp. NPDC006774]|uniref:relaxase/mobilization nuclease domain-containing protein n=1 Tax=Rhodococcus sp. NPDC006774 TaxID=3157186 RepID=UPI00340439F6